MKKKLFLAAFALMAGGAASAQVSNTLSTTNGSITFGPSSTADHADITTNKSKFMFMKPVFSSTGKFSSGSGALDLQTNGTSWLSISTIGRMTFNGDRMYFPNNSYLFFGGTAPGTARFVINFWNNTNTYLDYSKNLFFRNDDGGFSPLVLQGNGNVFIGMNTKYDAVVDMTQGYRLAVNGGILCEEVKVILDVPVSDYVFEPDYPLMSLDSVEAFVNENKHLPEVPSAAEFKANGYKVGEMDDLLLRKVEELTLYIIELKKEQTRLKEEVTTLREASGK